MRYIKILVFAFILSLGFSITTYAATLEDTVPAGCFYFSGPNELTSSEGVVNTTLFDDIIRGKQDDLIREMQDISSDRFATPKVLADLDGDNINIWNDTNFFSNQMKNTASYTIHVRRGNSDYKIFIPRGKASGGNGVPIDLPNNQSSLVYAQQSIEKFKDAVLEGVIAGSLATSFNIYSAYSEQIISLDKALIMAKDDNGKDLGYYTLRPNLNGISYGFAYFYNPLFGKMIGTTVPSDDAAWRLKAKEIKYTVDTSGYMSITINQDYKDFISGKSDESSLFFPIERSQINSSEGVNTFTTSKARKVVEPKSKLDSGMYMIVPKFYNMRDNDKYALKDVNGYGVISDIKLLISHNFVYGKDDSGKLKQIGDFSDYGLDKSGLALYYTEIETGKKVGAIIPLYFKEAVMDTVENKGKVYLTGRTIKMHNDFHLGMQLNTMSRELLTADTVLGSTPVKMGDFAFNPTADVKEADNHYEIETSPQTFMIGIDFKNEPSGLKGLVIYRNNAFLNNSDLLAWLKTNEAKTMRDVEAELLYEKIMGIFSMDNKPMPYDDYKRLQNIKRTLELNSSSRLLSTIRIISMVFGYGIIIYSFLLILAYWFDIFNTITEFSIMQKMTFGGLYPISSKESLDYIQGSQKGDIRYVTIKNVMIISFIGGLIGAIFVLNRPIMELLFNIYWYLKGWLGGI